LTDLGVSGRSEIASEREVECKPANPVTAPQLLRQATAPGGVSEDANDVARNHDLVRLVRAALWPRRVSPGRAVTR
jgi:hypothetical protein